MQVDLNRDIFQIEGEFELFFDGTNTIFRHKDSPNFVFDTNRVQIKWDKRKISVVILDKTPATEIKNLSIKVNNV